MNIKRVRISLKDLDQENFENVIRAFFDLPEPGSDEYIRRINELRGSLYFNLGYIELHVVKAVALDVNEVELKALYDVIS